MPVRPRRRGGPAPACPGRYKVQPEDFAVEELPLYEPAGDGDHTWLWVEKRGRTTLQVVEEMAARLGVAPREFGYAGLKDARAVTRQWISLQGLDQSRAADLESEAVRILRIARHRNKLKLGHLMGNRFDILVRDCRDLASVRGNLEHMARQGVPNYFGEQRFGKRGANLAKGMRILRGNPRRAARAIPKRLLRLLISAVQSEVFNRVLARRLETMDRMLAGDVAFLHDRGACFLCEDPAAEQPRCARFEISPSGPLPGPKMLQARGEPGELEAEVMAELGIDHEIFGRVPHGISQGARRPLRVRLGDAAATAETEGLRLRFSLPKGSYATSVLGELLTETPWVGDGT